MSTLPDAARLAAIEALNRKASEIKRKNPSWTTHLCSQQARRENPDLVKRAEVATATKRPSGLVFKGPSDARQQKETSMAHLQEEAKKLRAKTPGMSEGAALMAAMRANPVASFTVKEADAYLAGNR